MADKFYQKALYETFRLSKTEFLFENLNEGLIKSYSVNDVKRWLENDLNFQCINKVKILQHNVYISKAKNTSDSEFIEISLLTDPKSILSYDKIVQSCYCLLGWFTGIISVKVTQHNGSFKTYDFFRGEPYKKGHDYTNCFFSENMQSELKTFLICNLRQIYGISLFIEEKFPIKQYVYYFDEVFYHKTDKSFLNKILKNGLIPKSRFNYPARIYLTNNVDDLDDAELNITNEVILKIHLKRNEKLYVDPRSIGFFTYDNISPDEITIYKIN